ncbi:TPA: hypothetical protein N0F65_011787 [Lagenidium giganteum]|uniref:Uncharacterized protein n=1 Tax=Lagenidium giganteum TaxID=4803 RepID=A0AAV2YTD3_9STRA|nr:TPA: hypothetical protein N0F65_011787 [Lagenidium giganteum]
MRAGRAVWRHGVARSQPPVRVNASAAPRRVFCSAKQTDTNAQLSLGLGLASGGFAGAVSALTGVGGGLILIPTLAKFTKLPQQAVNGTSIGAVTISAAVGAWNYADAGSCNIPLALVTTAPSILFARYGVQAAHRLSSKKLSLVVGCAMLACSPLIILKNSQYFPKWSKNQSPLDLQFYGRQAEDQKPYTELVRSNLPGFALVNSKYVAAGAFAGFISGLCGLGGGILMTAYLTAASDMPQEAIIGTSLLSIVPTAASSTYYNMRAKSIHLPTALRIGGALAVSVYGTSKFVTHHVPEDALRGILATTLGAAAIVMMRRAI